MGNKKQSNKIQYTLKYKHQKPYNLELNQVVSHDSICLSPVRRTAHVGVESPTTLT